MCVHVCVVCCCCREQSLELAATNSVRLIFVLPRHESALLRRSRKQGNSARACSFFCCVASIARVVRIIGWHVGACSRVICVSLRKCFRYVSSFVVASRLRRLIVFTIFFYCTRTSLIFIDRLISLVDLFRSTFSTNLAMLSRSACVGRTNKHSP